jgi:autotransporter family porin
MRFTSTTLKAVASSIVALSLALGLVIAFPSVAAAADAYVALSPTSGAPGTSVTVSGSEFALRAKGTITFGGTRVATFKTNARGRFNVSFTVPSGAAGGTTTVTATAGTTSATTPFTTVSATTPTTAATTTTTSAPLTGAKATTRPVGSAPLSDAEAAARVARSSWEPRPENSIPNRRVPTAAEIADFRSLNATPALYKDRITGNYTGTTDEIIQWAAHKWGIDEDLIRAAAVQESWWRMSTLGDGGISYGLMQLKSTVSKGTYPLSKLSTAFNVDYFGASIRYYFDGAATWLNDPCCFSGNTYRAGDIWGSVGSWFAGRWYSPAAVDYADSVRSHLDNRTWSRPGF